MLIQTKKYLVLDLQHNPTYNEITDNINRIIKPRIINGFLRSDIKQALSLSSDWIPKTTDKLFFFPGCTVPRFKVRDKYTVTIKPEYATAAFINDKGLIGSDNTLEHHRDLMRITKDELIDIIDCYKDPHRKVLLQSISNVPVDEIFMTSNFYNASYDSHIFMQNGSTSYLNQVLHTSYYNRQHTPSASENQLLGYLPNSEINKLTCPIFLQDEILRKLNEDNLIIDATKYQELRAFGNAGDKDNKVLMMELMANSNFQKSTLYLLLLLREFGKSIYQFNEVNHINFKSLLNFFDLTRSDLEYTSRLNINKITNILVKHKKFTRENAMIVASICGRDNIDENDDACYWQPSVAIKPELQYLLDKPENDDSN